MQWLPRVLSGTVAAGVLALRAARAGRPKRRPKAAAERQRYASLPRVERAGGRRSAGRRRGVSGGGAPDAGVAALFFVMQVTGRTDWSRALRTKLTPGPEIA